MKLAPIALFVYNRPKHTQLTIEALKRNHQASESHLYIYSDSAKNEAAKLPVGLVRDYIKTVGGFKEITIIERDKNWGLANSIIDGVTMLCNIHGNIIVLEDDLETSPFFLDYMNSALQCYADEPKVIQISGYMFPVIIETEDDALFLPLTTSWGWATWQRAWQLFDPNSTGYLQLKTDLVLRKRFNLNGAYDYFSMLEYQLAGKVDSWAIRWYLSTFLLSGLTLYPRQSLILNVGFDGTGTHCDAPSYLLGESLNMNFSPKALPKEIKISNTWFDIQRSLKRPFSKLKMVLKKLVKIFLIKKRVENA